MRIVDFATYHTIFDTGDPHLFRCAPNQIHAWPETFQLGNTLPRMIGVAVPGKRFQRKMEFIVSHTIVAIFYSKVLTQ